MNSLLKIFFLCMFFLCGSYVRAEVDKINAYSFRGEVVDPKKGYIWWTYRNESKIAHCIRAEDVELKLIGDSLYVISEKNISIKYIGHMGNAILSITPRKFIVLPPGEEVIGSIYLNEYYQLKKENIFVIYSVPVIPCEKIVKGYIDIPPIVYMKDKVRDPSFIDMKVFESAYPEWSKYGFIASSERLYIKRKK